ncbi:MAG: DNA-directed DNA polymerase [Candidatus Roizmanbacteria bacterium GW2011_GWC2_37_13]|uniref:DNA-directed DNA polymerase n=1 Tax=Candidatus Roizmanbacteria bacterium GW2011_GWC2_37_13 TaxID=1618486 RepID=A0A0G0GHH7_9BACT|nr:MAG: DNA-directed DNA polymerase [Candidatus Roizmanbacteria bacterium GW2011_GWC1_37_12]KKQ25545.1 MAG: DNA-directed DNA polymerase [Candidatus Roizmanbacteria bacterium GW2011_GWC2_37_13]
MDLQINHDPPTIMHIDLNSCFATVAQQAHPRLREKPLVIAAYSTPSGCVLASSIEAKRLGIKTGMRVKDAKKICPNVIVRENDPELVRDVSDKFMKICSGYSPRVTPKSVDEIVINFSEAKNYWKKSLTQIGLEIKKRFLQEIGEWIFCNVGISTNRTLAKLASSLHKPDGLDVIDYKNIKQVYSSIKLVDFPGINFRYQARLNAAGIFSPLEFLAADDNFLRKIVFQSIVGHYWYLRLRGYEVDDYETTRKSFGQEYSLGQKTADREKLSQLLMMLTEKMGRRLRASCQTAQGIYLGILYDDWTFWHKGKKFNESLYTTQELFKKALIIFSQQPVKKTVRKISISCFGLSPVGNQNLTLFEMDLEKKRRISSAVDDINDRWGEYAVAPALMLESKKIILDRIAFGNRD